LPDVAKLEAAMAALPRSTRKVLVFPPYHYFSHFVNGSKNRARWRECKERVAGIGKHVAGVTVVDFLFDSAITLNDANYFDSTHYTVEIAGQLEDILGAVVMRTPSGEKPDEGQNDKDKPYRVLNRS
jgi:hypothetical protein